MLKTKSLQACSLVEPRENGAVGSTPLFGLNGYMLLKRVWFSGFGVLKRCEQGVFLDRRQAVSGLCVWNLSRNELFLSETGQCLTPSVTLLPFYPVTLH